MIRRFFHFRFPCCNGSVLRREFRRLFCQRLLAHRRRDSECAVVFRHRRVGDFPIASVTEWQVRKCLDWRRSSLAKLPHPLATSALLARTTRPGERGIQQNSSKFIKFRHVSRHRNMWHASRVGCVPPPRTKFIYPSRTISLPPQRWPPKHEPAARRGSHVISS
jgi:hypothetical protein